MTLSNINHKTPFLKSSLYDCRPIIYSRLPLLDLLQLRLSCAQFKTEIDEHLTREWKKFCAELKDFPELAISATRIITPIPSFCLPIFARDLIRRAEQAYTKAEYLFKRADSLETIHPIRKASTILLTACTAEEMCLLAKETTTIFHQCSLQHILFETSHRSIYNPTALSLAEKSLFTLTSTPYLNGCTQLNLEKNRYEQIPLTIFNLKQLTSLNLNNNPLQEIPEQISLPQNLLTLHLAKTSLHQFPSIVCSLSRLEYLDLSDNSLSELSERITQLTRLTWLSLKKNPLRELPSGMSQLLSLESLSLAQTSLCSFPEVVTSLTALQTLSLKGISMPSFPETLSALTNLVYLNLKRTSLTELPETLFSLTNLSELNIGSNYLFTIPCSISKLVHLELLWLSHNRLPEVPDEMRALEHLESIDLSHNRLREVPPALLSIEGLGYLDLSYNQLQEIPRGVREHPFDDELFIYNDNPDLLIQPLDIETLEGFGHLSFVDELLQAQDTEKQLKASIDTLFSLAGRKTRLFGSEATRVRHFLDPKKALKEMSTGEISTAIKYALKEAVQEFTAFAEKLKHPRLLQQNKLYQAQLKYFDDFQS